MMDTVLSQEFRKRMSDRAVMRLRELGYVDCDRDTLLSNPRYKQAFVGILRGTSVALAAFADEIETLTDTAPPTETPS